MVACKIQEVIAAQAWNYAIEVERESALLRIFSNIGDGWIGFLDWSSRIVRLGSPGVPSLLTTTGWPVARTMKAALSTSLTCWSSFVTLEAHSSQRRNAILSSEHYLDLPRSTLSTSTASSFVDHVQAPFEPRRVKIVMIVL